MVRRGIIFSLRGRTGPVKSGKRGIYKIVDVIVFPKG